MEINNVIYMELNSGPKIANSTCGKTIDVETIDRDSTVYRTQKFSTKEIISDFRRYTMVNHHRLFNQRCIDRRVY